MIVEGRHWTSLGNSIKKWCVRKNKKIQKANVCGAGIPGVVEIELVAIASETDGRGIGRNGDKPT